MGYSMLFLIIHYFWYPVTKSRKQKDRRGALVFDRYPGWCLGARRWAGTWWSFHGASADVGFHQRQNNHRVVTVRPKYWNWQRVPVWAPPKTWVETRSTPRESTVECNSFKTCYKDTIAKANRRNEARASWHCGHWSCQCFLVLHQRRALRPKWVRQSTVRRKRTNLQRFRVIKVMNCAFLERVFRFPSMHWARTDALGVYGLSARVFAKSRRLVQQPTTLFTSIFIQILLWFFRYNSWCWKIYNCKASFYQLNISFFGL